MAAILVKRQANLLPEQMTTFFFLREYVAFGGYILLCLELIFGSPLDITYEASEDHLRCQE